MESNKKIKVSVVIKQVADRQDKESANESSDLFTVLNQLKNLFGIVSSKSEEEEKSQLIDLLEASKFSNEIMANAFAKANREDLFDEKMGTVDAIDELIKQIKNI